MINVCMYVCMYMYVCGPCMYVYVCMWQGDLFCVIHTSKQIQTNIPIQTHMYTRQLEHWNHSNMPSAYIDTYTCMYTHQYRSDMPSSNTYTYTCMYTRQSGL